MKRQSTKITQYLSIHFTYLPLVIEVLKSLKFKNDKTKVDDYNQLTKDE